MPIGVYVRKPYMKSFGSSKPHRKAIVKALLSGRTCVSLARKYCLSLSTIKRIKKEHVAWL